MIYFWVIYVSAIYLWSICLSLIYLSVICVFVYLFIYPCIRSSIRSCTRSSIYPCANFGVFWVPSHIRHFCFLVNSSSYFSPLTSVLTTTVIAMWTDQSCQRECLACFFHMRRVVGHERCLVSTFFLGCLCSSCHIVAFHDLCVCFYFTPKISGQLSMQSQEAKLVLSTPYSTGAAVLSLATSLHEWQESSQYRRRIFHQMLLVAWICPTTALRPTPWHLFLELTSIQQSHWQSSRQSGYRMGSMINT